jgi:sulfate/thiosulfate-binding protein
VLLAWENEAYLAVKDLGPDKFDIIVPSLSILAEPPVAVVDKVVDRKKTKDVATAYLQFLYTPEGQEIIAKHYFRPRLPEIAERHKDLFPTVNLVTIDDPMFGGWVATQKKHFASGGVFDQIYAPSR